LSPKRLSTVIRKRREELGLTQEQVAKAAKVTKNYVTMLESGKRKNPSLVILKRIAVVLDVPVGRLLE
jgi:XRE family transcriptional regulator of biofilm formation